ncbi:MFS transporter [Alloalcanivorax xenomutans]|uniref:MFS transporter n=1 Tax=Alloalcanivorax xenomutans TaxID=1094342 RepID=UPI003D9B3452
MTPQDGLPLPRRYWALLTVGLAIGMAVMDNSMINVVLPVIAQDLEIPPSQSLWVVNAYLLAVVTTLLPLSSLGDLLGYRRISRAGLFVFICASLSCMLSPSLAHLTVSRFIQGLGAAGIMSVNVALVRLIFPTRLLGKGIGINAMVVALSTGLGPTVASSLLVVGNWRWLFAVNLLLGMVALLIAGRTLPDNVSSHQPFDFLSAALNVPGLGLLVFAIESLAHGAHANLVLIELFCAAAFLFLLIRRQLSRPHPMLPVDLLAIPSFTLAIITSTSSFASHMMAFIALPFYFHDVLGYSPVRAGFMVSPWPLAMMLVAPLAGALADRHPPGLLCGLGLAITGTGLIFLANLPAEPALFDIFWRTALAGIGFGLFHSPNNRALLSAVPRHRSGGAAGMQGTARLLGQSIGAAVAALIFQRFDNGAHAVLWASACVALTAAVISVSRMLAPSD